MADSEKKVNLKVTVLNNGERGLVLTEAIENSRRMNMKI